MSEGRLVLNTTLAGLAARDTARVRVRGEKQSREAALIDRVRRETWREAQQQWEKERAAWRQESERRWTALRHALDAFFRRFERQAAEELVSLAVRVAEILLRRALPDAPMLRRVLPDLLSPRVSLDGVRVRLAPEDARDLADAQHAVSGSTGPEYRVELIPDPSLARGDAIVETRNGCFDARLTERLRLVEEHLRRRLEQSPMRPT